MTAGHDGHAEIMSRISAAVPRDPVRADLQSARTAMDTLLALDREPTPDELAVVQRLVLVARNATTRGAERAIQTPDLAKICAAMPGRYRRVPTHFDPLDRLTNGGLQSRRMVVVGGPPGVTKSGWTLFLGHEMARLGATVNGARHEVHVAFVAGDEPRDGLLSRIGQMGGLRRADLETEELSISTPAWARVATLLEDAPNLTIWDPREELGATVEYVGETLAERTKGKSSRGVLIVDSLQTAAFRADAQTLERSPRERIDARMRALQFLAIRHGLAVIVISELNRGGYRLAAEADLSAFKESSAIEYGVDVALLMKRVKDEERLIDVTAVKNRLGETDVVFRMERTGRCTFLPAAAADEERKKEDIDAAKRQRGETATDAAKAQFVKALLACRNPPSSRLALLELVDGDSNVKGRAITQLQNEGRLHGGRGKPFRIVTTPPEDPARAVDRSDRSEPI